MWLASTILLCLHICTGVWADKDRDASETQLLSRLLNKADSKIRPNAGGDPVDVAVSFHIVSFGSINEVDMDYTMDIFLRQSWNDVRMTFEGRTKPVTVPAKSVDRMWLPDIFFPNEKSASLHHITVPNTLMKIWPNGTIMHSVRITLTLSCPMILTHFPLDSQQCYFKVESYGHETSDLTLHWAEEGAVELDEEMRLPQFDLVRYDKVDCHKRYRTGDYPCLKIRFSLRRQYGFYMLQTYIPSILIVILSWVSFWINVEAVPARISLGVTTVLTMATQLTGSRTNAPKVSYPKAMDIWMAMCMIFVFGSLLEYAFVNVLARNNTKDKKDEDEDQEIFEPDGKDGSCKVKVYKKPKKETNMADMVDRFSRVLFPGSFLLFNILYWSIYSQAQFEM